MASKKRISGWVLLAQVGNLDAMDQLLRTVQGPLHYYLRNLTQNADLADDLLQEVLLRICRKLKTLRDPTLFRPWCYRIASREAFKQLRRRRKFASPEMLDAVAAPADEQAPSPEVIKHMLAELEEISPASRAVLFLHYLESMPLSDVAAALAIPVGTVKSRLAYGLKILRRRLKDAETF